ncbi:sialidase, partial [Metarhizium hybridum]
MLHSHSLEAGVAFNFTFPSPSTPPSQDAFTIDPAHSFDPSLLELPCVRPHARSSSKASSIYSTVSTVESTPDSACTRLTTPPRASPPVHQHGPVLLPKIRHQDQHIDACHPAHHTPQHTPVSMSKLHRARNTTPVSNRASSVRSVRSSHARSYTNPEVLTNMAYAHLSSFPSGGSLHEQQYSSNPAPLLSSPANFHNFNGCHNSNRGSNASVATAQPDGMSAVPRQASTACYSLDASTLGKYGYTTYRQMPFMATTTSALHTPPPEFSFSSYDPRSQSPLSLDGTPEPVAAPLTSSTTLINYLMESNPAASLVRTISFPMRDPSIRHFWWDVRNIRPWSSFNAQAIFALPGASGLLTTPVPASLLPQASMSSRNPETEVSLHNIYTSYYLPKLNSALAISSSRPLQFSVPTKSSSSVKELLFVANAAGESSSAAAIFGGKPLARVVGLVRSFDRFNTGMRVEGNVKRVEYLRGLSALHHAMREHSCRYGFILTEIELVLVRCGTESTPFFGDLEVTSVQLSVTAPDANDGDDAEVSTPLTACLALWGMCQLASDDTPAGHAHWRADIGAPAEGTRRKAKPRDSWMPQPQLAEKREAKRSRGWIWPEDAIGRKELGKRGVKYAGI